MTFCHPRSCPCEKSSSERAVRRSRHAGCAE